MSEYAVIYEQGLTSWGAWVPDLPGCKVADRRVHEVHPGGSLRLPCCRAARGVRRVVSARARATVEDG
jgi:hypothetical protein